MLEQLRSDLGRCELILANLPMQVLDQVLDQDLGWVVI